jgi:hypothetical protein
VKTEGEVRQKLKQVLYRHRQKRIQAVFRQAPETCTHNSTLEPRGRHDNAGGVQACVYTTDGVPRGVVCDVRYDNGQRARNCPLWEGRTTKSEVKAEVREILESGNRGLIAKNFPDAAALMWVLDSSSPPEDGEPEPEPEPESFWGRLPWFKGKP